MVVVARAAATKTVRCAICGEVIREGEEIAWNPNEPWRCQWHTVCALEYTLNAAERESYR